MKRILCSTAIVFAVWLPITATFTACRAPSAQRVTYNSLYSVGRTVDAAYRSYLDLVLAGQVSTNKVPAISRQYNEFQAVFGTAVALAASNTNAPPEPRVAAQAASLTAAIADARGSK